MVQLRRAAASPVEVHLTTEHRVVDVMSIYGLRIEIATGRLTGLLLNVIEGRVRRWPMPTPNISLVASPATNEVINILIRWNAKTWAQEAGAAALDWDMLNTLAGRLVDSVWARWQKDGTLDRLRQRVAKAFQLDPVIVRLARQVAEFRGSAHDAHEADYNRALADKGALTILEREAPHLMPLLVELMAPGECTGEPMRALRRTMLDKLGGPRHWRRFLTLPAETLRWARTAPARPLAGALLDLATLVARVDSPITPPLDWLQAHLNSGGDLHLMVGMDHQTRLKAVRAHLGAWVRADTLAKDQLLIELQIVHDWIDRQNPKAPQGLRNWSWWIRHALAWDQQHRFATHAEPGPTSVAEGQVWVMDDIEFRPIRGAVDVYEEARAMANCLDRWRSRLDAGQAIAWSVRDRHTGRRIATVGVHDIADHCVQVKGFANRPLPPEVAQRLSREATALRQRGDSGGPARPSPAPTDPELPETRPDETPQEFFDGLVCLPEGPPWTADDPDPFVQMAVRSGFTTALPTTSPPSRSDTEPPRAAGGPGDAST